MEHEVCVPVPVPALRRTLGDPARVARCVPGLQQDADASAGPLSGRLRFRAGGHTITYRGALRLTPLPGDPDVDSVYAVSVAGEGTEARGGGSAKLALTLRLTERDGGTAVVFEGTASGDGRLAELDPAAALSAAHRLLDRFAQQLVTETLAEHGADDGSVEPVTGIAADELAVGEAVEKALEEAAEEADKTGPPNGSPVSGSEPPADGDEVPPTHEAAADEAPAGDRKQDGDSLFDAPVPPSSLDPVAGIEFTVPDAPAEAAHARRTMIGRSAEEVDHAPPRGRYAPVPSPDSGGAGATLRWVAPAAALALASAVVVGRALRRRR
ncbi:SRPBCC domain-containing protein [Streptomyces sp. ITFR-16]|uniref:SRPBCC domain-containing protein n=1 Tax=Streptomyces sp. ITFR-16 TaxID=3075198 RepID=UPI00288C0DD1|nr:SRPBCC domain-containing protein [Streptomyces sp. ITFR-16]WNI23898.1 SRPBCC domain-containing protein [Streptomyces sp. ITFR-16]